MKLKSNLLKSLEAKKIQKILGNTQTETIPTDDLLVDYFTRPDDYDIVFNNIPALIDGIRGTGKSMILRFFEIDELRKFQKNPKKVEILPVYFKIREHNFTFFNPDKFRRYENFVDVFRHYFNINIMIKILDVLRTKTTRKRFKTNLELFSDEFREKFSNLLINCQIDRSTADSSCFNVHSLIEFFLYMQKNIIIDLKRKSFEDVKFDKTPRFFEDIDFLFNAFEIIKVFLLENSKLILFILLDEYDKFSKDQQALINPLIKERRSCLTFKIACKSGSFFNTSYPNQTIDTIHDINWKTINRPIFSFGISKFQSYVEEIVNRRFRSIYPDFSIKEILGKSEPSKEKINKIKGSRGLGRKIDYFGAEDLIRVSSGVARHYMNLCNQILIAGITKKDSPDFSKRIQHEAIIEYSQNQVHYAQDSTEHGEDFFKLLTALSEVFRSRYALDLVHPATMSFAIRDFVSLGENSKELLKNAEREGIIFRFFRRGKDGYYTQMTYGLNGVFAPANNLLPIYPDAVQIQASVFDLILVSQKDFFKAMKISKDQESLDKYFSDEENRS